MTEDHPADRVALLDIKDLTKVYPSGTVALRGADLAVGEGSVHGLVGANGAGKSTLIKILSGSQPATSGAITFDGRSVSWSRPRDAQDAGVATVYQDTPLVPTLSVLENVYLFRGGLRRRSEALRDEYNELCDRIDFRLDPDTLISELSIGQRQMVAITQALATGARLIVMDEPTASLAEDERQIVFAAVRSLARAGTSVLYVSHFLDEVLSLTDEVTVLRDGAAVLSRPTAGLQESELIASIVGDKVLTQFGKKHGPPSSQPLLEVRRLFAGDAVHDVSFDIMRGEVLGVAGLLGSGRSELLHGILGADRTRRGEVRLAGADVPANAVRAVAMGIGLVPEDRNSQGIVREWPIWKTISLPDLPRLSRASMWPEVTRERERAATATADLSIRADSADTPTDSLSGGNAQKVMFAKWLYGKTRVLLLDEPTAGVDVGAKADILALIRKFAEAGNAVLVVTSELEELIHVSDRVLVLCQGRAVAVRDARHTDEQELLALASGLASNSEENQ